MRKSILRLSCGLAALAVVTLSLCFSGKPARAKSKVASAQTFAIPHSFGAYKSPGLRNIGLPDLSIIRAAVAGEATTTSAASLSVGPLAIGSLAAGFGSGLAVATESVPDDRFPTTNLGGVTVTVVDWLERTHTAGIIYVSPTQINHEIPINASPGPATITYTNTVTGESSVSFVDLAPVAPGLFTMNMTGNGIANALILRKRNGAPDVYEVPYKIENGQVIPVPIDFGPETDRLLFVLFGTGFRFRSSLSAVTVTVGGIPLESVYAGRSGDDRPFMDQFNGWLPRSLAGRGLVNVTMDVDGMTSNTAQLSLR
jgi:uncharacterized protein (TIGR03437 family)